jgi:glycosyltransferase involved in cell wall biosynthesis
MARGIPVLASDTLSLSEIVADAAVTVNPRDHREIARALARLIGDRDLSENLRRRGLAHAARFSWDATARQVLAILRKAAQP